MKCLCCGRTGTIEELCAQCIETEAIISRDDAEEHHIRIMMANPEYHEPEND